MYDFLFYLFVFGRANGQTEPKQSKISFFSIEIAISIEIIDWMDKIEFYDFCCWRRRETFFLSEFDGTVNDRNS